MMRQAAGGSQPDLGVAGLTGRDGDLGFLRGFFGRALVSGGAQSYFDRAGLPDYELKPLDDRAAGLLLSRCAGRPGGLCG